LAALPIRIVPDSPATPWSPMSMLLEPVVRFSPAPEPIAMFEAPVVRTDYRSSRCKNQRG
jgi:hypothetical protein